MQALCAEGHGLVSELILKEPKCGSERSRTALIF